MNDLCPVDGETLSRFLDDELPPFEYREIEAHLPSCDSCAFRVGRFRVANVAVLRAMSSPGSNSRASTVLASLSVAAALMASIATNLLLVPKTRDVSRPGLELAAAPSDTLTSFYEKVAPPRVRP